ncbi:MAG: hypothetical protein K7J47_16875 [Acidobacteria bacterium]|jgi:uncharacterized protein (TIGR03437 family)|nr:hypothetical protein [Bryobacteraceae bacterium CoA2 C42]
MPRAALALAPLFAATPLLLTAQPPSPAAALPPVRQTLGFNVDAPPLNFIYTYGSGSEPKFLSLSGPPQPFTVRVTTSSSHWLEVTPNTGTTPQQLQVSVSPSPTMGLTPGLHTGFIIIRNSASYQEVSIPVTVTPVGSPFSSQPASLAVTLPVGSPESVITTLSIGSNFAAGITSTSDVPWLTVTPFRTNTPALLTATVSAAQLAPGTFNGKIRIATFPEGELTVPVTLAVVPPGPVFSVPSLQFQQAAGNIVPPAQTIDITSNGAPFRFTFATSGPCNCLIVSANANATPARLTVTASPAALPVGVHRGVITVTPAGGISRSLDVTFTLTPPPPPAIGGINHGATFRPVAVSPGLIFSLFGSNLGLITGLSAMTSPALQLPKALDGTRVLFDGVPAPLLYARENQINGLVPYSVAGKSTVQLRVEYKGQLSPAQELRIAPTAPGLFTLAATGTSQAAALNQDGSVNSPAKPETAGRAIILYGTGEGLLDSPVEDGLITGATLRRPLLPVSATVGGVPVDVLYAGTAPGMVAGVLQINLLLNEKVPQGDAVPVEIRIGNTPSAPGPTISVR